jgi:hypothetical protein
MLYFMLIAYVFCVVWSVQTLLKGDNIAKAEAIIIEWTLTLDQFADLWFQ